MQKTNLSNIYAKSLVLRKKKLFMLKILLNARLFFIYKLLYLKKISFF